MASTKEKQPVPPFVRNDARAQYANNPPYPYDHFRYHSHGPGLYGLTVEEIATIQQCRSDSTWKYAMPTAGAAALATHLAVRGGYLRPGRGGGSLFKVTVAAVLGNFLGRFLYVRFGNCQEKLAKLDTPVGETARKLNQAGLRLPPYVIVAGAETHPWAQGPWDYWQRGFWNDPQRGYGAGYRYVSGENTSEQRGPEPTAETAAEDKSKSARQ